MNTRPRDYHGDRPCQAFRAYWRIAAPPLRRLNWLQRFQRRRRIYARSIQSLL